MTKTGPTSRVLTIVGLLVIILALLDLAPRDGSALLIQGTMGYFAVNMALVLLGAYILIPSLLATMFGERKEDAHVNPPPSEQVGRTSPDLTPLVLPPPLTNEGGEHDHDLSKELIQVKEFMDRVFGKAEMEKAREEHLILRLLSGDEKVVYQTILNAGGEILQKDLIIKTKMSNAKASRTIDRLEGRGILTKERYGATNRLKINVFPKTGATGHERLFNN